MDEIIQLENQYYILTSSQRVDDRVCVLKQGDTFGVFDRYGDIQPLGKGDQGLYHKGTRFLSRLHLTVCGQRPLLLGSSQNMNNLISNSDMTNPDIGLGTENPMPRGSLHIFRTKFLWDGVLCDRVRITNLSMQTLMTTLLFQLAGDFVDIFEVRGHPREKRGTTNAPSWGDSELLMAYEGLDGVNRSTRIRCSPEPISLSGTKAEFAAKLLPKMESVFTLCVSCETSASVPGVQSYDAMLEKANSVLESMRHDESPAHTSNESFNQWLQRSTTDLRTMVTRTPQGLYPYAGIPWFSTPFGRDGLITALQTLWLNPEIARGVLNYLAHKQAVEIDPARDAEPGKILHEVREGEMAALNEIPFGRYYGSVDSTPLFVILAAAYYERTADKNFLETLWPNVERALNWIDAYGDSDGDGFVTYARRSARGLLHQGWKDSHDSVFHEDGQLAEGPIALCEVQAYVYEAKTRAAWLADVLKRGPQAEKLRAEAEALRSHFEKAFWCEDLGTYALALDGHKKPCRVRTSNAGHCLFSGIASPEHAARVAATLLKDTSFSGWGIRTVDSQEVRYNPMSYHNGSVWPHDNALIAAGFWRYGLRQEMHQVLAGLFELSKHVELRRLPELICGFHQRPHEAPTIYPSACAPQAWAAGTPLLLLSNLLGLSIQAPLRKVTLTRPMLPAFLQEITIQHLRVGDASLNITVRGKLDDVDVQIQREKGSVETHVFQ